MQEKSPAQTGLSVHLVLIEALFSRTLVLGGAEAEHHERDRRQEEVQDQETCTVPEALEEAVDADELHDGAGGSSGSIAYPFTFQSVPVIEAQAYATGSLKACKIDVQNTTSCALWLWGLSPVSNYSVTFHIALRGYLA